MNTQKLLRMGKWFLPSLVGVILSASLTPAATASECGESTSKAGCGDCCSALSKKPEWSNNHCACKETGW